MNIFKRIGLYAHHRNTCVGDTLQELEIFLRKHGFSCVIEAQTANLFKQVNGEVISSKELAKHCDIVVIAGGDGSVLHASRDLVDTQLPLLAVNRGRLGFLTDIAPSEFERVHDVLRGEYQIDNRFLLKAFVDKSEGEKQLLALNEVALLSSNARLIEFEVFVNDKFVYNLRADGLIVASPTGSTAYTLSAGGPIMHPHLDAILLTPLSPHTLSTRPVVISADSDITIVLKDSNGSEPRLTFDGQEHLFIDEGDSIRIRKYDKIIRLIHPTDYEFFSRLRLKLHWGISIQEREER